MGIILIGAVQAGGGVFEQSPCKGEQPAAVALADVDADGIADVVAAYRTGRMVSVSRGLGNGSFDEPQEFGVAAGSGPPPSAVAVRDLDHDGNADIVVATSPVAQGGRGLIYALYG